jgi:hypothetical protein
MYIMKNINLTNRHKLYIATVWWLLMATHAFAQNVSIENLLKAKPVVVSGGVGANTVFTAGLPNNDASINYFLNGNLNFNFFGTVNVPLSFNFSDRKIALSQGYSFNQLSISPTYKWITARIGTNYMTFSPYTLNGHQFVGGGLELVPKNWKIQLMAGRLIKGQYEDTTATTGPTFKRMGYGAKVEYNPGTFVAGVTVFRAYDDPNSIPELKRSFGGQVINPKDNLVMSLTFGTTLFHALQFNVEYANSIVTKDSSPLYENLKINSLAGIFGNTNATSESYHAFKSRLNYNIKATNTIIGLGYEVIDPNYTTLGGYYFVNDMRNYTLNASQTLMGGKLSLSGNIGLQQDDIKKTRASNQDRFVGSINANATISEGFTMGINFSNFQSYKFINDTYSRLTRVPGQVIDTLSYAMVSSTLGYSLSKSLSKSDTKESRINFNATIIGTSSKRGGTINTDGKTDIFNSSLTYSIAYTKQKSSINSTLSYFRNALYNGTIQGIGPTIGFQKTFIQKLNATLNISALNVTNNMIGFDSSSSLALNIQAMANLSAGKNHNFNFNTGVVNNIGKTYINGNIGYNYSF